MRTEQEIKDMISTLEKTLDKNKCEDLPSIAIEAAISTLSWVEGKLSNLIETF